MKKITPIFQGEVVDGKLKLVGADKFQLWIKTLDGKKVNVTVKAQKKNRSLSQNAYYWGVLIELLRDHLGYTPDEMHEALKWQFLRIRHAKLPTVRSTAAMSTAEFTDFIEQVRTWAASELAIVIPDPSSVDV